MDHLWKFTENPFEFATRNNYRLLERWSAIHLIRLIVGLANDPCIAPLFQGFKAFRLEYAQSFKHWEQARADCLHASCAARKLLRQLAMEKIGDWQRAVRLEYPGDSPVFMALFPNGRRPFQGGHLLESLRSLDALSISLESYPVFNALKQEIDGFLSQLGQIEDMKFNAKLALSRALREVEKARLRIASRMNSHFGMLLYWFSAVKGKAEWYFGGGEF